MARRLTEEGSLGRSRYVPFLEQRLEGHEQIEVQLPEMRTHASDYDNALGK